MHDSSSISVVVLTYNESTYLLRALEHVRGSAREIFVIESFSSDNRVQLAKAGGAQMLQHPFSIRRYSFAGHLRMRRLGGTRALGEACDFAEEKRPGLRSFLANG